MSTVAAAMEETATNIRLVSESADQLSATITEIAASSGSGPGCDRHRHGGVPGAVSQIVSELGAAAKEIDAVTDSIREVSEQVNLLALNATIEAARAGEAGKGFAVVAGEIKALARQASEATNAADDKLALDAVQDQ
jgi:methyl-accepting chemotaxis protein